MKIEPWMKRYARMTWYILAGLLTFFITQWILGVSDTCFYVIGSFCALATDYLGDKYK